MKKFDNFCLSRCRGQLKMHKAQIWVETVVYTLIILAIIAVLLSILMPVINQKKDQATIQQSITLLNQLDSAIRDVRYYGAGNSIPIEMQIKKGQLTINPIDGKITFFMKSSYMFSEPGQTISNGNINITTIKLSKDYDVSLSLNYENIINLTWNKKSDNKIFNYAPTTYKIWVTNNGRETNQLINVDLNS